MILAAEDMRAGQPLQCTQIDENAKKGLEFLNAMTPKEAEKYMGGWTAAAGGGIVAHGEGSGRACEEGRKAAGCCACGTFAQARRGAVARQRPALRPVAAAGNFMSICIQAQR